MLNFYNNFWTDRNTDRWTPVKQYAPNLSMQGIKMMVASDLTFYYVFKAQFLLVQLISIVICTFLLLDKLNHFPNKPWFSYF